MQNISKNHNSYIQITVILSIGIQHTSCKGIWRLELCQAIGDSIYRTLRKNISILRKLTLRKNVWDFHSSINKMQGLRKQCDLTDINKNILNKTFTYLTIDKCLDIGLKFDILYFIIFSSAFFRSVQFCILLLVPIFEANVL